MWQIVCVKDCLVPKIKKHEKCQMCVMYLIIHRGITLILFRRFAIHPVCLFDVYLFVLRSMA